MQCLTAAAAILAIAASDTWAGDAKPAAERPLPVVGRPRLTLMLYDNAGLRASNRRDMIAETSRILLAAGIEIDWVECELAGKAPHLEECAIPPGPNRLTVQLVSGMNQKKPRALGKATGFVACVYPEMVAAFATIAKWDFPDLLGHAVAHELGHILLGSSEHSPAGVMRTAWPVETMRGLSHAALVFRPDEIRTIRARLSGRLDRVAMTRLQ